MEKYNKKTFINAYSKTILCSVILLLIALSVVSAWEVDNVKSFDKENLQYGKITITNAFGLGSKLAEYTLTYNTDICLKDCYAEGTTIIYTEDNLFTGMKFYQGRNTKELSYKIYLKEYYNISNNCNLIKNGTACIENKTLYNLVEYKGEVLKAGTYDWVLLGTKEPEESVDWIGSAYGKELDEWAPWAADVTLREEYTTPSGASNKACNVVEGNCGQKFTIGTTGANNNFSLTGISFYGYNAGASDMANFSIWTDGGVLVNKTTCIASNYTNISSIASSVVWNNITMPSINLNRSTSYWLFMEANNGAGKYIRWYVNPTGTYAGGWAYAGGYGGYLSDEDFLFQVWGTGGGSINLNYPEDSFSTISNDVPFNCTAVGGGTNIQNVSLYFNNNLNYTILGDATSLELNNTINDFTTGTYNWTCRARNTDNILITTLNRTFYITDIIQGTDVYNASSFQSRIESFILNNLTYNNNFYTNIEANLIYNGTSYTGAKIATENNATFTKTGIIIPATNSLITINNTFYWQIKLTDASSNIRYINSTFRNQTINPLILTACNATYNVTFINFSIKDEKTNAFVNSSFSATFNYGLSSKNTNYSYSNTTGNTSIYSFCVYPETLSIITDMSAEYSAPYYPARTYNLFNANLTNATTNINLFLLNETDAVKFFFTLTSGLSPVTNALVTISKYNPGTGTYEAIGLRESDTDGKFIEYLELDKEYQFSVSKNGEFLGIIYKTALCEAAPCQINLELESAATNLWTGYYSTYATNVAYNLSYNATNKNITFVFVDLTGLAQYFRLEVVKIAYNQTSGIVCNTTSFTTAGTIICSLAANTYSDGNFRATAYISRSPEKLIDIIYIVRAAIKDIIGNEGLLFTIIIVCVLAFIGIWSPAVGIVLVTAAILFSFLMGFLSVSWTTIMLLIIFAIFIIIKMGSGGREV